VEGDGQLLFEQIVKMGLEGIVCKRLTVQSDGEAVSLLDQDQEFTLQPITRA